MEIDTLEQISNIVGEFGTFFISFLLACLAWKAHQWSKRLRRGSPVEGRCYYSFGQQNEAAVEYNLPCTIIPDIDIDKPTKTVKRARIFRESHTWFNFQGALFDPKYIKKWDSSIWIYHNMPTQTVSMFLHWKDVIRFEVWYENKWQTLDPYQSEVEKA